MNRLRPSFSGCAALAAPVSGQQGLTLTFRQLQLLPWCIGIQTHGSHVYHEEKSKNVFDFYQYPHLNWGLFESIIGQIFKI